MAKQEFIKGDEVEFIPDTNKYIVDGEVQHDGTVVINEPNENRTQWVNISKIRKVTNTNITLSEKQYPECEKLAEHEGFIRNVLEFIEYAESYGIGLSVYNKELDEERKEKPAWYDCVAVMDSVNPEKLIHAMLGIDDKKLEQERGQMLSDIRAS